MHFTFAIIYQVFAGIGNSRITQINSALLNNSQIDEIIQESENRINEFTSTATNNIQSDINENRDY